MTCVAAAGCNQCMNHAHTTLRKLDSKHVKPLSLQCKLVFVNEYRVTSLLQLQPCPQPFLSFAEKTHLVQNDEG